MTQLDLNFDGGNEDRPLLERIMDSETLREAYHNEMCWLRENWFNSEFLEPRLDELKALIQDAVYADDNKMYSNNQFNNNFTSNQGGMGGTLYGLKPFIDDRSDYVDNNLDCTSDIGSNDADIGAIIVYPNPASEQLRIEFNMPLSSICIFNAQGQEVMKMTNPKPTVLHVQDWPQGVYLMVFETATCTETTRVILQ